MFFSINKDKITQRIQPTTPKAKNYRLSNIICESAKQFALQHFRVREECRLDRVFFKQRKFQITNDSVVKCIGSQRLGLTDNIPSTCVSLHIH